MADGVPSKLAQEERDRRVPAATDLDHERVEASPVQALSVLHIELVVMWG